MATEPAGATQDPAAMVPGQASSLLAPGFLSDVESDVWQGARWSRLHMDSRLLAEQEADR